MIYLICLEVTKIVMMEGFKLLWLRDRIGVEKTFGPLPKIFLLRQDSIAHS